LLLLVPLAVPHAISVAGLDKVVHALLFLWLTLTTLWIRRKTAVVYVLLIFGALIELTQGLTPYRSAEMLDWLADALGVLLAWWCWRYARISTA
jgi:VanZ family protein